MITRVCSIHNLIWDKKEKVLIQEASSLDFPVNVFPDIIKVQGKSETVDFERSYTCSDNGEISKVEYLPKETYEKSGVKKLVILND